MSRPLSALKQTLLISLPWLAVEPANQTAMPSGIPEYIVPFDEDVLALVMLDDPAVACQRDKRLAETYE